MRYLSVILAKGSVDYCPPDVTNPSSLAQLFFVESTHTLKFIYLFFFFASGTLFALQPALGHKNNIILKRGNTMNTLTKTALTTEVLVCVLLLDIAIFGFVLGVHLAASTWIAGTAFLFGVLAIRCLLEDKKKDRLTHR